MNLVRSLIFVALFYVWSAVLAILFAPLMLTPLSLILRAFRFWSLGVMTLLRVCCGVRVELRGREFVPKGAAVIAAKHQCMFDVFAEFAWLPRNCFVMKKELLLIPFFGWYARRTGMIALDRRGRSDALRKLVRAAKARFAEGRQLVIFPEGSRGEPGRAGDYQPGVAALYRELAAPVVPVATNSGVHWPAHGFVRKPGLIVFEYLPPIPAGLPRKAFMARLEETIETASNRLIAL
jgi:1-acyl-sn-glycerol-3-phosphate acyltransferase